MRILSLTFALALAVPAIGHAQSPTYQDAMRANANLQIAAQRSGAPTTSVIATTPLASRAVMADEFNSRRPGATMMIIGGAALLAGLLTDGGVSTALILSGIGLGAYGFYVYQR